MLETSRRTENESIFTYFFFQVTASAIVLSGVSATSLNICEASYQGVNERVLACPGGRIRITGATYGRPSDDRETCCANAKKCGVKAGDTCTVSALDWVTNKCEGMLPTFTCSNLKKLEIGLKVCSITDTIPKNAIKTSLNAHCGEA